MITIAASWGPIPGTHILSDAAVVAGERSRLASMAELSDEELMARVAQGDERAFRSLAQRHVGLSIGLAFKLLGNRADAEEIAQEAMVRVWTQAPRWQPQAKFRTWLYRVVTNLAIDRQRKKPMLDLEAAGDPVDPAPQAVERIESRETSAMVRKAIADLPDRQRAALVLTYYEGLSNIEAADLLGTSVGGLESLLVRARRTLRDVLDPRINKH